MQVIMSLQLTEKDKNVQILAKILTDLFNKKKFDLSKNFQIYLNFCNMNQNDKSIKNLQRLIKSLNQKA